MHNILLADDHTVIRTGLKLLVNEYFDNIEIHEANSGAEIKHQLQKCSLDLIIMDIRMPETDAIELTQFIKTRYPETNILIFSISPEETHASRFLKEGAKGFVSKDASLEELKKAIQLVLDGRMYISQKLTERLAHHVDDKFINPFDSLSSREFEVASSILAGNCLMDIARSLNLRPSTVGTHKARLLDKLNVANIIELKELADFHKVI